MLLDIAFAFLVILGYLVAIIMAVKSNKTQQINISLSDEDIERIATKVAEKISHPLRIMMPHPETYEWIGDGVHPDFLKGGKHSISMDESPVVVKSKTDGMELAVTELGKVEETEEKVSTSSLAKLKGKK